MENINQQQLDNLYYNLGMNITGGVKTTHPTQSMKDNQKAILTDDEIIKSGREFSNYSNLDTAQRNYDYQVQKYQNLKDMKARGDTGNYGKNTRGFNISMKNEAKRLSKLREELEKFKTFKSGMDTITAGGTIDRVDPYAGKVFDTYKGWVEPPEEIPGQAPIVQGDNMMESTIGGAMAPYLPEDIVSTYNVPKDDSLVASGAGRIRIDGTYTGTTSPAVGYHGRL